MSSKARLIVELEPDGQSWTVTGPTSEIDRRTVSSPLADADFLAALAELREWASRPVRRNDPQARGTEEYMQRIARQVGEPLEHTLFSSDSLKEILSNLDTEPVRLTLRVNGQNDWADRVLALPWELMGGGPTGRSIEVVREAVAQGAPNLPKPRGALAMTALIAAPEDSSPLAYEEEALRLQVALATLRHQASFADLGGLHDLAELAEAEEPQILHFSGHTREGRLLFEDELGLADEVTVEELVRQLNRGLLNPARPGRFPSAFFLSLRGRISAVPGSKPSDLESGPITAARLHRAGFALVLGFFGPVDGEMTSRAEEAFYASLAGGETALRAAAVARATLTEPLGESAGERRYPLGNVLMSLYLRGPDRALSDGRSVPPQAPLQRRRVVELHGLPVLERGFVGRRGLQHEILRRIESGQRLIVLQGLGGLGKTALASHLMTRVLAPDEPGDRLILRCRELSETEDPLLELWSQAEDHGTLLELPGWSGRTGYLRVTISGAAEGLAATIHEIWRHRPNLVVYIDNAESLQIGPRGSEARSLGSWRPGLEGWWPEIERLAEEGPLVLASTRYAWDTLDARAHLAIDPLSEAETWRLLESFDHLARLPSDVRLRLVKRLEGHPRALEFLDLLVGLRLQEIGRIPDDEDAWAELIEPILPGQGQRLRGDLLLEELWKRLPDEAWHHAERLVVLRQSAPVWVVDRLGPARDALIRASLLTRYREAIAGEPRVRWVDRWGLHGLVREHIERALPERNYETAHRAAGEAWADWLKRPGWLRTDQREAIFHLHAAGETARAWPIVRDHFHWLRLQGRYREAQLLLEEAIRSGLGDETLPLARVLLANVLTVQGDPAVESLYEQVLASETSEELRAQALHEYAVYLDLASRYEEAETQVRRALEIKRTCLDMADEEIGVTMILLGRILESRSDYIEAEKVLHEALSILKGASEEFLPQVAVAWHSLARVVDKLGRLADAETMFRKAAELDLQTTGEDDPQYAVSLQSLGWILAQRGKADEAEGWLRKALDIEERSFGREHQETGTTLLTLARVLLQQERNREAEELLREVIAIDRRTLSEDHADRGYALNVLGGLMFKEGRLVEAENLLREALSIQEPALGEEHFVLVSPLTNLAGVLVGQGRASEAEPLLERALGLAQQVQGPEGPDTARVLPWLARAQAQLRRPQATDTARRALDLLHRALGPDHPTTRTSEPALREILGNS